MSKKVTSVITDISLNRATFSDVSVNELSYINFFYGNNGSGKSSIAHAIDEDDGVVWADEHRRSDYDVIVYNQDFIANNFQSYGNVNGVFIIGRKDIEAKRKVAELTMQKNARLQNRDIAREEYRVKNAKMDAELVDFQNACFSKTAELRKRFEKCMDGKKLKKGFAAAVLNENKPTEQDLDRLMRLYDVVYDDSARVYPEWQRVGFKPSFDSLPGKALMEKVIISSVDTTFANFIKTLGVTASAWVRDGHTHYSEAAGDKCPYCQQILPINFEADIAACFDAQYQKDIEYLEQFRAAYESGTADIIRVLKANLHDVPETVDTKAYSDKITLLESRYKINCQRISEKCREPSSVVLLEETGRLLVEIDEMIFDINNAVRENNRAVNEKKAGKDICKTEIMQHLAFLLTDEVKKYRAKIDRLKKEMSDLVDHGKQLNEEIYELSCQISELNKHNSNTEAAVDSINSVLRDSGFQGFGIRAKMGVENVYEIVRENGCVAENLSEGERNFLAFLYFCQLVRGSRTSDELKDKIVVIDDPVSGMDNTALFIVSRMVREMIGICRNNTEHRDPDTQSDNIKQLFILTHNVQFHHEISYDQTGYFDCTSFYVIHKSENASDVKLCKRKSREVPSEEENYNPIQNSYAAMWEELRDLNAAIPTINVMRRILEYYFLQLCGYEGSELRHIVLDKIECCENLLSSSDNVRNKTAAFRLASSLMKYIGDSDGIVGSVGYAEDCDDVDSYRFVFKMIFEIMGHTQHYNLMFNKAKS